MTVKSEFIHYKKDQIILTAGDTDTNLLYVKNGLVMVFVQSGSKITPVAHIKGDELIGELAFFDGSNRSASIIALEDTEIIKIYSDDLRKKIPDWLIKIGEQLARKIRGNDEIIRNKGIRKTRTKADNVKPLTIEEQTKIYKLLEERKKKDA